MSNLTAEEINSLNPEKESHNLSTSSSSALSEVPDSSTSLDTSISNKYDTINIKIDSSKDVTAISKTDDATKSNYEVSISGLKFRARPSSCVFVASLNKNKNEDELYESVSTYFSKWGDISVKVLKDEKQRPYSFVQFTNDNDAKLALEEAQGTMLDGRSLRCEPARVNRTVYFANKTGLKISYKSLLSMVEPFGEIELIVAGEDKLDDYIPKNREYQKSKFWFVQFVYREEAICSYLHFSGNPSLEVEWAENIQISNPDNSITIDKTSIFVGQLSPQVTEKDFVERFLSHGKIKSFAFIQRHNNTFGFIKYEEESSAARAVERENHSIFMKKTMHVQYKELHPKENKTINKFSKEPRLVLAPSPVGTALKAQQNKKKSFLQRNSRHSYNHNNSGYNHHHYNSNNSSNNNFRKDNSSYFQNYSNRNHYNYNNNYLNGVANNGSHKNNFMNDYNSNNDVSNSFGQGMFKINNQNGFSYQPVSNSSYQLNDVNYLLNNNNKMGNDHILAVSNDNSFSSHNNNDAFNKFNAVDINDGGTPDSNVTISIKKDNEQDSDHENDKNHEVDDCSVESSPSGKSTFSQAKSQYSDVSSFQDFKKDIKTFVPTGGSNLMNNNYYYSHPAMLAEQLSSSGRLISGAHESFTDSFNNNTRYINGAAVPGPGSRQMMAAGPGPAPKSSYYNCLPMYSYYVDGIGYNNMQPSSAANPYYMYYTTPAGAGGGPPPPPPVGSAATSAKFNYGSLGTANSIPSVNSGNGNFYTFAAN